MTEKVTKWAAKNGKIFDTESEALYEEEITLLSEHLAEALNCSSEMGRRHVDGLLTQGWAVPNLLSSLLRRKRTKPCAE